MKSIRKILLTAGLLLLSALFADLSAQHTLGAYGGYGMGTARFYPEQETKSVWGLYTAGLSWRHYGKQRIAGGFGVDLEYLQSAFCYAPNSYIGVEEKDKWRYYTRRVETISLPIVWQPHFYIKQRVRIFLEAAAVFSYRFGGTYENEYAKEYGAEDWQGDYHYKTARDNRWGYGLAGGGGVAVLIKQFEVQARVRYYFGMGDLLRNRNKYADWSSDSSSENPFWAQPLRSPLDNLMITLGVSYRFNKEGFDVWFLPKRKREKSQVGFGYQEGGSAAEQKGSSKSSAGGRRSVGQPGRSNRR